MKPFIFLFILFILLQGICFAGSYQYRDKKGVLHFTDNISDIPENQRPKEKSLSLQDVIREQEEAMKKQRDKAEAEAYHRMQDPRIIDNLLLQLKGETHQANLSDWEVRAYAATWLRYSKDPRVVEPLIAALQDRHPAVWKAAAISLGEIGDTRATQPLLSLFMQDGINMNTQQSIALSIGKLKDPSAIPSLVGMLHHKEKSIRQNVILALGEIGHPDAVEPLLLFLNDTDRVIQSHAIKALGSIKDPRVIKPLITAFRDQETHYTIKEKIADALVHMGDPQAVKLLIDVLKYQGYKDETQTRAATTLGKLGDPRAIEPLFAILKYKEARHITRNAAAEALGRIKDQNALKRLITALKDEDKYVRRQAGIGLGIMKDPAAITALLNALNDPDKRVVQNAGFALSQIGMPAMESLISVLKDKNQNTHVRSCAAMALGSLNAPSSENALKAVAGNVNENQHIRRSAQNGLQKLQEQRRYIKKLRIRN